MLSTTLATILHRSAPAPIPRPWHFDATSALIGAAVALLLAGLAYRNRDALRSGWEGVLEPLVHWRNLLRAGTEGRYRDSVATWARSTTLPVSEVSLDRIFVEPRLFLPSPVPQSLSDIETREDSPKVLPLRQTLGGHPRLLIVGAAGTGRTTLLAHVALACAHAEHDGDPAAGAEATPGPLQERLPIYVPLPAMNWDDAESTGEHQRDTTEEVVDAAVSAVGAGRRAVSALRQRLEAGQAVVLVDGWDDLSLEDRQRAAPWLADLVDALPGNLWLATAGTRGYGRLAEAGFVPLRLAAWDASQVETFAHQWTEIFPPAGEPPPVALRGLTVELQRAAREGATPLELALRALVFHADGRAPAKRAALFDRALDCLLWQEEEPWLAGTCRAVLEQLALDLQQQERSTASREEIQQAIESVLPPPEERPARAATLIFRTLTGPRGLLRPAISHRYALAHSLWQAYLATCQLAAGDPTDLIERMDDPRWAEVLRFYAELGDMGPLATAWLRRPTDVFHTHLHTLSSWIHAAPDAAAWCNGAMAVLARNTLQPGLPIPVRRALAEALAATRAPGLTYFFRQATQHADAEVRAAAALGLTRTASEPDLPAIEALLEDQDDVVREAATRGLAHMGIDAATHWLAEILVAGDETLSAIAAEALGQCGEEGVAFLRQAVESEDVVVRRGAVLGLAQVGARDLLERVAREDEQWIVRSAAVTALDELAARETVSGVAPPPEIEQLPWLISWAASQGEGVGTGDAARQMIWRAMSQGDAPTRLAAAQTLCQVGHPDDVEPLRTALADDDPDVAHAALEALAEISRRYDLTIE